MCFANRDTLLGRMSRVKSRAQIEICGDCSASDPSWASINRGILLCAECCSVHRSLGRHISQVKSLRQGSWSPAVLEYVNALNAHGANSVWEHCLMDSVAPKNLKRKPTARDPLHPTKAEFIQAKHVNLSFVLKPNLQQLDEGAANLEIELSKQLHASVRSGNLETSLRLLVQGADPNFYHEEKGSTPLHVAAKSGQVCQIELLIVYGANLSARDAAGYTPYETALQIGQSIIADRLMEAMYEVTDRLTYYLIGKKPDHASGKHLLVPEQINSEISEQLKIARGKLQLVPNKMFEELVMDLYDEVDRREMEKIWATSALNPEIGAVPFLPTNPHLSATRNQGRQKLARFSQNEFVGLLTDVLLDAKRRQNIATLRPLDHAPLPMHTTDGPSSLPTIFNLKMQAQRSDRHSNMSDDEPLYDAVASDDDYAALAPSAQQKKVAPNKTLSDHEVELLRKKLQESFHEIDELKSMVKKLSAENCELKSRYDPAVSGGAFDVPLRIDIQTNGDHIDENHTYESAADEALATFGKRPVSMYEQREGPYMNKMQQIPESRTTNSMYQMVDGKYGSTVGSNSATSSFNGGTGSNISLPRIDDVKMRTDIVTRCIQDLWNVMQDKSAKEVFIPCAERIRAAVADLTAIFPEKINDETILLALKQLNQSTSLVQRDCVTLQQRLLNNDTNSIELCMKEVRNGAYNLAKATKMLVTQFQ